MIAENIEANRALGQIASTFRAFALYALLPKILAMAEEESAEVPPPGAFAEPPPSR